MLYINKYRKDWKIGQLQTTTTTTTTRLPALTFYCNRHTIKPATIFCHFMPELTLIQNKYSTFIVQQRLTFWSKYC